MSTINAEGFGQICDGVWRDRAAILFWRGVLSGEAALVRAAHRRLSEAGDDPGQRVDDYAPSLRKLVRQYRDEAAQKSC